MFGENFLYPCGRFLSTSDNYQFLKGMRSLVAKSGYKLKICHEYMNRGDRWMQVRNTNVPHFGLDSRFTCSEQQIDARVGMGKPCSGCGDRAAPGGRQETDCILE